MHFDIVHIENPGKDKIGLSDNVFHYLGWGAWVGGWGVFNTKQASSDKPQMCQYSQSSLASLPH